MLVTLSGMFRLIRELQFSKVKSLMLVTPFGMLTLVRELQPAKA